MLRNIISCARISLSRMFLDGKFYLAAGMVVVFGFYAYLPVTEIAFFYGIKVSPWLFPFFLAWPQMQLLYSGFCILLFVDVFHSDAYGQYMMVRCGRICYYLGQLCYILLASMFFVLFIVMVSLLFVLPVLHPEEDWGTILYTLARNSKQVQQQTGAVLAFVVDESFLDIFSPARAMGLSFLCMWLTTAFVGGLIGFFRIFINKTCGILAAGAFLGMEAFCLSMGPTLFGRWLLYLSPLSWAYLGNLDWYGSGRKPSLPYGLGTLCVLLVLMGILGLFKYQKKDVE